MSEISNSSEQLPPPSLFAFDYHDKHFEVKEEAQRREKNAMIEDLAIYDPSGKKVGKIHGKRETISSGEQFTAFSSINATLNRTTGISTERGLIRETIIQAAIQFFGKWRSSAHLNPSTGVPLYEKISQDPRVTVYQEKDEDGLVRQIVVKNFDS